MSRGNASSLVPVAIILAIVFVVLPANAYNVAIYGTNAGFDPSLHSGMVTVVKSIPGGTGADLDANIDSFVDPSVDVIILGGDGTFSPSTAAKIEAAVAGGKILVVTYPCNEMFGASLPATNGGASAGGKYLEISDPSSAAAKAIFAQLPARFDLRGPPPDKEQAVANAGTMTVLSFDTGLPALIYGKYGKGYVVEWTAVPSPSYMTPAQADIIDQRMILGLLPEPAAAQTTVIPGKTTAAATQPVPSGPVQTAGSAGTTGDVMVYSSPAGASILIDGVYTGTTPRTVTGVPAGNHILRLTMSGYNDYEGSIYVVPGQANQGYGTLQPSGQVSAAPTATATVYVPVTVTPTAVATEKEDPLHNSSVIVAIIGVITALIAAGASIFTHVRPPPPPKKE